MIIDDTKILKGTTIYKDHDFGVSYKETGGLPVAHCEVWHWSPSIAKRCRLVIDKLMREHRRDVLGISKPGDRKHHKFLRMMGFTFFRNKWILDDDGEDLTISIWIRHYKENI
mgnify:CR=1 FL=1